MRNIILAGAILAGLSACATTGGEASGSQWTEVVRTEGRNMFFIDQPVREGDLVTFQLSQVFQTNTYNVDGVYGRFQLWPRVQVNCENWTVALNRRTRWAEDGSVMKDDDMPTFDEILTDFPADHAAKAACRGEYPDNALKVRGGETQLVAAARASLGTN